MTAQQPDDPSDQLHDSAPTSTGDDAVEAQLSEVRERLLRDAAAAGVATDAVVEALHRTAKQYADAPVRSFVGVLVERDVRADLNLRAVRDTDL